MAKCGFDHNVFQRLGAFDGPTEYWWQGLDGTQLFCHWMRSTYRVLYPAPGNLHEFKQFADLHLAQLKKHALTPHLLAVSGADLTHVQSHVTDLFAEYNRSFDDVEFRISTPAEYFEQIKDSVEFPLFEGDLNPVFQGCYSARIAVKQWNRKVETALVNAELADALAVQLGGRSQAAQLARTWEGVLFNQFHDIICGSHVDKVYVNTIDRYKAAGAAATECLEAAFDDVVARIDTQGKGIPLVVFNPLSWNRDDVVEYRIGFSEQDVLDIEVRDSAGTPVPHDLIACERYNTGGIKRATVLFICRDVPALGYEVYRVVAAAEAPAETTLQTNQVTFITADVHVDVLENEFFRLEIDSWNGAIRSLYDKRADWEVIGADQPYGNTVVCELDNGNFWEYNGHCKGDALYPMNRAHPLPAEQDSRAAFSHHYGGDGRVTRGHARLDYQVNFPFGEGFFATRVRLYDGLPRIDIHTTLINEDERVRYRMALPTSLPEGTITQEIPFGAIERPAGEFPAQNWMDYSDTDHGIALLNRGLPGNCVDHGVVLLSLLKATALKEGYGESGGYNKNTKTTDGYELGVTHEFDYALVPHEGDWRDAGISRRGMEFNRPLMGLKTTRHEGSLPQRFSLIEVAEGDGLAVSTVRDTPEGMVVRVYETEGRGQKAAQLRFAFPLKAAFETNLIEQEASPLPLTSGERSLIFDITPFEIKTFRLVFS